MRRIGSAVRLQGPGLDLSRDEVKRGSWKPEQRRSGALCWRHRDRFWPRYGPCQDDQWKAQKSLFSRAKILAEKPVGQSIKNGKPNPKTLSMFNFGAYA